MSLAAAHPGGREAARHALSEMFAQHREGLLESATDWVVAQALDLRGQRPREETRRLVERVIAWNEALILRADESVMREFIDFVTTYRASTEFHVSTLLKGFLSFRMAVEARVRASDMDAQIALDVLSIVDEAYFVAIFQMTDQYVFKLNGQILERRRQLEHELSELTEARIRELNEKIAVIRMQEQLLAEVSFPTIRVARGVLVLPIIGELDAARAGDMKRNLLDAIVEQRARVVLLDITGLRTVDSQAAHALIGTLRAVRLLGSRGLVVGVSPAAARAMVALGVDLDELRAFATLEDGLRAAGVGREPSGAAA